METTPLIRPALDDDVPAIAAIYADHVRHGFASFETDPPTTAEIARRRAALLDQGYPYLVATLDGAVAGYAYAGPYRPRAAYRDTVENSVYLHPDRIGSGLGTALLSALIAACEDRGFRQMVAVVGDSGNHRSVRLHQRLGFRLVGTLESVGHKHGRWLDTVLLQRALGAANTAPPLARGAERERA
ncbi:MAG TPA: GNAT family N-acetyltransferase [Rhodopila sp.]|uniref:GNAT family N-acetyltransferase n=1 Tax=Rhodopila sp. TaxID=2480087 RepID=UPI002C64DDB1|nr:GNAT family N-acetyltransferase [Rhodopila sp.]HVY14735.1 GNAT family N-acetyltransferase [Rhodopila sp.]